MRGSRNDRQASGRFLLRISPALHRLLRQAAGDLKLSLNDYCSQRLSAPCGSAISFAGASQALQLAAEIFAERLIGVAAFGSRARGEASTGSDLDLLIVIEDTIPLSRQLYRAWEKRAAGVVSDDIEPHFVHLPPPDQTVGGIWAEVAIDGIVLFERGLRLSSRLIEIRHDILVGKLKRKRVHGQNYWSEVA